MGELFQWLDTNVWVANWVGAAITGLFLAGAIMGLMWRRRKIWVRFASALVRLVASGKRTLLLVYLKGYRVLHQRVMSTRTKVELFLLRKGGAVVRLNLSTNPGFAEIWKAQHINTDLSRVGLLSLRLYSYLHSEDNAQQSQNISSFVLTHAVKDLLVSGTFDLELFCTLVAEYIVETGPRTLPWDLSDGDPDNSFPVPFDVIEPVVRDLIGEEKPRIIGTPPEDAVEPDQDDGPGTL